MKKFHSSFHVTQMILGRWSLFIFVTFGTENIVRLYLFLIKSEEIVFFMLNIYIHMLKPINSLYMTNSETHFVGHENIE